MITINGVLTVKQISGANGKFCTGDLNTSIGEFKVKESILDQFEEGRYEGEFVIERFYLTSYVWRGKSTTDIRAKVTDIRLDTAEEGVVDNTMPEPDPINEDDIKPTVSAIIADLPQESKEAEPAITNDEAKSFSDLSVSEKREQYLAELGNPAFWPALTDVQRDAALIEIEAKHQLDLAVEKLTSIFGDDLVDAVLENKPVKLDPAVDRVLFRQQRDVLKERGYLFDAKTQSWAKKEGE